MFSINNAAITDANRVLTSQNIMNTATGLGEMINLTPAAPACDYNNRRAARRNIFARPARPIYRDRALQVR